MYFVFDCGCIHSLAYDKDFPLVRGHAPTEAAAWNPTSRSSNPGVCDSQSPGNELKNLDAVQGSQSTLQSPIL